LVKVELAGVSAEDIEIEIQGNVLYIAGTRRDKSCAAGVSYHQMEITYSRFEKTLTFPASIEGAHIEHNFDNGLLIIHLLKSGRTKA
ncbi:MAG: Hsp20/alpha crystallin family protein, partial [Actinomycetota bacterium]